jgi:hypothetical protein
MAERRYQGPVQTDPIRERLGKPGVARDVLCSNCGLIHATRRRWQLRCPECNPIWIDRSSRSLLDDLRDMRLQVVTVLLMIFAVVVGIGGFGLFIGWLFAEAAETWGWDRTYGLAAFFIACLVSLAVLGRLFTDRHNAE